MESKILFRIIRQLSTEIEKDPNNGMLYFERAMAYFRYENWYNAEDDFSKAIELDSNNDEYLLYRGIAYFNQNKWTAAIADFQKITWSAGEHENYDIYRTYLCRAFEQVQSISTMDERMAPYVEMIKKIRKELAKNKKSLIEIGEFLNFKTQEDYTELVAALSFLEEYELLTYFLKERHELAYTLDILNTNVRPEFAFWEPSPLYFITGRNQWTKMQDPCKMLRFLVNSGANVNLEARDKSTPLWNQTNTSGSIKILQTLLELGADPNQISIDDKYEWAPLPNCLLPLSIDDEGINWQPFDKLAIEKAKLLLKFGANPNLASPTLPDYPPLVLAINYGSHPCYSSIDILELIDLLLQYGANSNFVDVNGNTPLSMAAEKGLLEVGQLLLTYEAKMPKMEFLALKVTEACHFRPGGGEDWGNVKIFPKNEVFENSTNILKTDSYKIFIEKKTPTSLDGKIFLDNQGENFSFGNFHLNEDNKLYRTESKNVSYDLHIQFTLEFLYRGDNDELNDQTLIDQKDESPSEIKLSYKKEEVDEKYDVQFEQKRASPISFLLSKLLQRPGAFHTNYASAENLLQADIKLGQLGFPKLPKGYLVFLETCNGLAFDSIELYGTETFNSTETKFQLVDIITATKSFYDLYSNNETPRDSYSLLCFGRDNGDYYVYDSHTKKYQVHSHECLQDVWGEYATFDDFFMKEIGKRIEQ